MTTPPEKLECLKMERSWETSTTCSLLEKLPREVRDKIWRYLLVKFPTISPGLVTIWSPAVRWEGTSKPHYDDRISYKKYAYYTWDQYPDPGCGDYQSVPYIYREDPMIRSISWTTNPTKEQQQMIQEGKLGPDVNVDEDDVDTEANTVTDSEDSVKCEVHYRKHFGAQIINSATLPLFPFHRSTNIMQTCRQIEHECSLVLYGENSYAFNSYQTSRNQDLNQMPSDILGLMSDTGVSLSPSELRQAIEKLFCWKCRHSRYLSQDPLIKFMRMIGPRNSSLLQHIKISGRFEAAHKVGPYGQYNEWLGLGKLLPIYTAIIREVCTDFRKLTIHDENMSSDDCIYYLRFYRSDVESMSDEERLDKIIQRAVKDLPALRELQLGDYINVPRPEDDKWGEVSTMDVICEGKIQKSNAAVKRGG